MEMQFAMDTMNAVPTPRFGVGEKQFAAQLLQRTCQCGLGAQRGHNTHMTSGNKLKLPPTTRNSAK